MQKIKESKMDKEKYRKQKLRRAIIKSIRFVMVMIGAILYFYMGTIEGVQWGLAILAGAFIGVGMGFGD